MQSSNPSTPSDIKQAGRPKSYNPKSKSIPTRLDKSTEEILERYCEKHKTSRSEAIREAIHRLDQDEHEYFWSPEWRQRLLDNEQGLRNGEAEMHRIVQDLLQLIQGMSARMNSKTGSDQNEKES
ncbi:ribbon-helix-helix protein, CopG family [Paenibacillus sp. FSL L8-0463]|uniref:ribbon-helix-helix protein, CopG family n=1 Tax=Paenibacillus sp. FSL L8-0463 TaxID=2954687 RepID=UPI00311A1201